MNEENAKFLVGVYPTLFKVFTDRYGDRAHHQLAIGDGWFDTINEMCAKIDSLRLHHLFKGNMLSIDFVQIKEKLGTLRVYYNTSFNGESWGSYIFRTIDEFIRTYMYKWGFYKAYWAMFRFRRKYIYETVYEKIGSIVNNAEAKSAHICEICGNKGKRCIPDYWVQTLCEYHETEMKEKIKEEKEKENE